MGSSREAIYRVFSAIAAGCDPTAQDLATLNATLAEALSQLQIVPAESGFVWSWSRKAISFDWTRWPIVHSAAELLTSPDLDRVRECSDENCGWLFLDTSRNCSRRWCTMKGCGNRAKARRHYQRKRQHML